MLKFLPVICVNKRSSKIITQNANSWGRELRCLHSLYAIGVAPDAGATGPSCGRMEGITLPLLQRGWRLGKKKAEGEGEKVHCRPSERLGAGGTHT